MDYQKRKKTAPNEQFGASGGADSSDTEQVTTSFALVRTSPMPPACRQAATTLGAMWRCPVDLQYLDSEDFTLCILTPLQKNIRRNST